MLDPAFVRERLDDVRKGLLSRGLDASAELEQLATLESHRRRVIPQVEGLRREQNTASDEVARVKRGGGDASSIFEANKQRAQKIKQLEVEFDGIERQRLKILEVLPNLPHASVTVGSSSADNPVVRTWGEPRTFDFEA